MRRPGPRLSGETGPEVAPQVTVPPVGPGVGLAGSFRRAPQTPSSRGPLAGHLLVVGQTRPSVPGRHVADTFLPLTTQPAGVGFAEVVSGPVVAV